MCKNSHDFEHTRNNLLFEQNIDDVTLAVVLCVCSENKIEKLCKVWASQKYYWIRSSLLYVMIICIRFSVLVIGL